MKRLVYAHRGAAAEEPENTLPSFRLALDLGANALETDVHLTADGQIVVSHDPTGARMAGVPKSIEESTLAEVRAWDAGWGVIDASGARPFAGRGYTVPTLEELLVEFPGVPLNVDAKSRHPEMVPALLRLLRRRRAQDCVRVASFSDLNVLRARRAGYEGSTGLSPMEVAAVRFLPLGALRHWKLAGRALQVSPRSAGLSLDDPAFIAKCHSLGLRVDYWTINSATEARRLFAAGADGVMTDDPRSVAPALRDLGG
ncbi:MAG: glycerophosphodiester phosphodiesterase family protein [Myxococcales bacterium]|jgi:glycerophosphoryl diester phosphodiesterase